MRFSSPYFLILLLAIPIISYVGWPSRGYGRQRETLSLILRLIIAFCLVMALAGTEILRTSDNLAVVFIADVSDSMSSSMLDASMDYIRSAMNEMAPDDQSAIILFGEDALVEKPMSTSKDIGDFTSIPRTSQTDLAEAIRLALALYPSDASRRLVILSDGVVTQGNTVEATNLATESGVDIILVPFVQEAAPEAMITDLRAPNYLFKDEAFDLEMTVTATEAMRTGIRIMASGSSVYETSVDLNRGTQTLKLPLKAENSGFINYVVQITPQHDRFYQNNEVADFTQVVGPPKILIVAPPEGEALPYSEETRPNEFSHLVQALRAADFDIDLVLPHNLPSELPLISEYHSLVLVDVPARELTSRQMEVVQKYVRDLGGGLAAIGGPTSYGVGGYFRTPFEETLPLEMIIRDQERRPSLTIVFIIDRSGSMADTSGGIAKLELAKEAAARSVELMFPTDRVGVIAFDDRAQWIVDIVEISNPDRVLDNIGSIRSGGGTDILAGLEAMANELPEDPASVKHVILLTDGGANPAGIPQLVKKLHSENEITLTTVGVGSDSAPFLEDIAHLGGGRYHFTEDPGSIPSIFTEETTLASRSYIIEETFVPKVQNNSPILSGIDEIPPLQGYVGTTAKNTAQTILVSEKGDPILAIWQYGLGKALAFTSDASPRWARDWIPWNGFSTFWTQAVRFTVSDPTDTNLEISILHDNENPKLIVDAQTQSGQYLNNYNLTSNVFTPDGNVVDLNLSQIAPGLYETEFYPEGQGVYLIRVDGTSKEGENDISGIKGWVGSYSPEYRNLQSSPDTLFRLSAQTDAYITRGDPAEAFNHNLSAPESSRPIWSQLLTIAVILLPFDIAVRRLAITGRDVRRAIMNLMRQPHSDETTTTQPARSQRIQTLLQAKQRVHDEIEPGIPTIIQSEGKENVAPYKEGAYSKEPDRTKVKLSSEDEAVEEGRKEPESTAAILLKKKRERDQGE